MRWLKLPALLTLLLVVASDLLTDRVPALQFLWWLPRIALLLPALLWLLALLGMTWVIKDSTNDRKRLAMWLAVAVVVGGIVLSRDFGFPAARPPQSLRLVHWNAACVNGNESKIALARLMALEADAIIVTDPCELLGDGRFQTLTSAGYNIKNAGRFTVISRFAVREARAVFASRDRHASRIVFSTPMGELSVIALDLPSEPTLPRYQLARVFANELAPSLVGDEDIFVGDFNITRGSASLGVLAKDFDDAFIAAGTGWGGTYPRTAPLWAIDLMLLREPWHALRAEVIDLGAGRHCGQVVDLECELEAR